MKIQPNSALFLDRDGVINDETKQHYVTSWAQFEFLEGSLEAIALFSTIFNKIFIATNQRVVGKQIITQQELEAIHDNMLTTVTKAHGRIDKIYYCTAVNDDDSNRKPNTGMALQAKNDFPEINFAQSIMIGNSLGDMEFGKKMGMNTIFIRSSKRDFALPHELIDYKFSNLLAAAQFIQQQNA
jgi:D-glycero-D-manno-heptose 1,7-bisphosphate phosphatase